jgi:hypothetical protein
LIAVGGGGGGGMDPGLVSELMKMAPWLMPDSGQGQPQGGAPQHYAAQYAAQYAGQVRTPSGAPS